MKESKLAAMVRESPGGSKSEGGRRARRRWRPTAVTAILLLASNSSCGLFESDSAAGNNGTPAGAGSGGSGQSGATGGETESGGSSGSGGTSNMGSASNTAGTLNLGGGGVCAKDDAPLTDQVVAQIGPQRVFYSWTTDEQVAELRAGGPLFTRSERPGMGRGLAFTELAAFAAAGETPQQKLAAALESEVFAKVRFSWTNPWATLLGWPGETYGTQLLQIELQPDAWIAVYDPNGLVVYDAQGEVVPIETALENPQQIGAIYYQSVADEASNYCGTFSFGAVSFREFILGNISMVKRWSLATPEIVQRLDDDIAALRTFEERLACFSVLDQGAWSSSVSCLWSERYFAGSFLLDYEYSLGIPSELYWPSPENIEALIAALEASMPTGEPLEVTPGG